jgi:glucose-6-phosphate isomerase
MGRFGRMATMSGWRIEARGIASSYRQACQRLEQARFAENLWRRTLPGWTADDSSGEGITSRLGWLQAVDFAQGQISRLHAFGDRVRGEGVSDVVLLGMGGSSLAPEVLRQILGSAPGYPRFHVLDSVNPDAVRDAFSNAESSLFVFASKSGSTIEPNVMAAEARRRLEATGIAHWGSRFVAITDEGTSLHRQAEAEPFFELFLNPSDIGGRYSALSFFGLVPAALMGIDVERLLGPAREMTLACQAPNPEVNPGLALGAAMAAAAGEGRDKLVLLVPHRYASLGLWIEQLVGESTGKDGKGIVPVAGESTDAPLGPDRIVVAFETADAHPDAGLLQRARETDVPVLTLEMPDGMSIGAEFFRWEVATAVTGFLLGVNPFDEPNVQQAKDATRALLDVYESTRALPAPRADSALGSTQLSASQAVLELLGAEPVTRFLDLITDRDYFGLLAYTPPHDEAFAASLDQLRRGVAMSRGCATTFGYGPRYLHSTGQLHKGGGNNGVFLIVTTAPTDDLPIPGKVFTFGVLEHAQALGDFQSLDGAGRRVLLANLRSRDPGLLRDLTTRLLDG